MQYLNIVPLGDRVLCRRDPVPDQSSGGIILPEKGRQNERSGEVVAVGPGRWNVERGERDPMNVKVGDHILFPRYGGVEIEDSEDDLVVMHEVDVLALLE